jgi:hypothetical protein
MKITPNQIKKQIDISLTNQIMKAQTHFLLEAQINTKKNKSTTSTTATPSTKKIEIEGKVRKILQSSLSKNQNLKDNPNFSYSINVVLFNNDEELVSYYKNSDLDKKLRNFIKLSSFFFQDEELYQNCCFEYNSTSVALKNTTDDLDANLEIIEIENIYALFKRISIHAQQLY